MLAPQRVSASGRGKAKLRAGLVRRLDHPADQLRLDLRTLALVHAEQRFRIKPDAPVLRQVQGLIQQVLHRLDVTRQRVLVVQQVDLVNCHACGNRADANLERRDAERLANLLVRVAKLLHKLRIRRLE